MGGGGGGALLAAAMPPGFMSGAEVEELESHIRKEHEVEIEERTAEIDKQLEEEARIKDEMEEMRRKTKKGDVEAAGAWRVLWKLHASAHEERVHPGPSPQPNLAH